MLLTHDCWLVCTVSGNHRWICFLDDVVCLLAGDHEGEDAFAVTEAGRNNHKMRATWRWTWTFEFDWRTQEVMNEACMTEKRRCSRFVSLDISRTRKYRRRTTVNELYEPWHLISTILLILIAIRSKQLKHSVKFSGKEVLILLFAANV